MAIIETHRVHARAAAARSALRLLVETIEFGATTDAAPVLGASKALSALL